MKQICNWHYAVIFSTKLAFFSFIITLFLVAHNLQAGGVTIVTHGYYEDSFDWGAAMRSAIADRAASKGSVSLYSLFISNTNNPASNILNLNSDDSLGNAASGEANIYLDWRHYSTEGQNIENIAYTAVQRLIQDGYLLEQPIHLIGHSRGGWLVGQIARCLAEKNIWIDQVTFLDPARITLGEAPLYLFHDPLAEPYDNIVFADEYYQTNQDWVGYPLNWVSLKDLSLIFADDSVGGRDHTTVHDWYHGTIDTNATEVDERTIDRANWYNNDFAFGYNLSRIGHNEDTNALRSLIRRDGLSEYHGGYSERDSVTRLNAGECWPNIMIKNCGSYQIVQGQSIQINGVYNTPANATIQLLTDNDSNPYTSSTGREITSFSVSASQNHLTRDSFNYNWYPISADNGKYLYVKIVANGKTRYYYLPQTVNVTAAPVINLTNGTNIPLSGTTADAFKWSVHYTDSSGNGPQDQEKKVYIDGSPYTMSLSSGTSADGTYEFGGGGLAVGVHNYYFQFKSANGVIVRAPTSGTYSGPAISSSSSGGGRCEVEVRYGTNVYGEDGVGGYVWPPQSYFWHTKYSAGDTLTFEAHPGFGWQLDHWIYRYIWSPGDYWYTLTTTSGLYAMLTIGDYTYVSIRCIFKRDHNDKRILTINATGPGSTSPATGQSERTLNSSVTLNATPNPNGRFVEWQDENGNNLSTNSSYTITMNDDKTVKALFVYNITQVYTNELQCVTNATIFEWDPSQSYFNGDMIVRYYGSAYNPKRVKSGAIKFSLSPIMSSAIIKKTTLNIHSGSCDGNRGSLHRIDNEWTEQNIVNFSPVFSTVLEEMTIYDNTVRDFDLGSAGNQCVQQWVNGTVGNNGFLIRMHQEIIDRDNAYTMTVKGCGTEQPVLKVEWEGPRLFPVTAVTPSNINVAAIKDVSSTNTTLNIRNSGEGTLNYTVAKDASWLTLSGDTSSSSTGQTKQVTLSFSDTGLALGTYNGTVTVTDNDSSNSNAPVQIPVAFTVLGPDIWISTNSISASACFNTNPTNNVLSVCNSKYGTLNYTISTNASWLRVNPNSGTSTGEVDSIDINYNVTGLNTGIYSGTISISDPIATNSPVTVNVQLTVLPPAPSVPTGLSASDGSDTGKVEITWNEVTWATSYELWRNTTGNTNSVSLITSQAGTNYADNTTVPGALYYYWVKAVNYTDTSPMSGSNSGYRAISAPSSLAASDGTYSDKVRLTWNSTPGAEGYNIFRHTINNSSAATHIGDASGIGFNDTNAISGTLYYYWVKATNAVCASDFSAAASGYRAMSAPISMNASDGLFTNKVLISWSASDSASAYLIWRNGSNHSDSAINIGIASTTNYNDSNTTAGVTYYYWISASNSICQSSLSTPNYGHKAIYGAPVSPTNTVASDGDYSNRVLVTWSIVSNATGYQVWRATTDDFSLAVQVSTNNIAVAIYDDATAIPGTQYYYWIKATNSAGISGFGDPDDIGWRGMPPPATISASDETSTDKVQVTWSFVLGATSYEVWRGTSADQMSVLSNQVIGTALDDCSVIPGITYYYRVKAKNASMSSALGDPDTGYCKMPTLVGIAASDGTFADKIRVTWSTGSGAVGYQVWRGTSADDLTQLPSQVANATYDDTSADPERTYYYAVKAIGANSALSDISATDSGWRGNAPAITANPSDQTVDVGASINFVVGATGSAPLHYQWQKDGSNISGANAATYAISSAALSDAGSYQCVVTNACGAAASASAILKVNVPWIAAPANVSSSDGVYTNKVRVNWDVVSNATSYEVWRSMANDSSTAAKLSDVTPSMTASMRESLTLRDAANHLVLAPLATSVNYDDTRASAGVVYYYWVKAKNTSAISAFSASDSGYQKSGLLPPIGVTASDGTYTGKVRIVWTTMSGATSYEIWRAPGNVPAFASQIGEASGSLYDDTSATACTIYYYWIKSKNSSETSDFSLSDSGYRTNGTAIHIQPAVKINGESGEVTLRKGDTLSLAIYLMTSSEINADWWIVAVIPGGIWYYYDVYAGGWLPITGTFTPTYQGALFDFLAPIELLNMNTYWLPTGVYVFYFGVDTNMNGMLDMPPILVYDSTTMNLVE